MTSANEDRELKVTSILHLLKDLDKLRPVDLDSSKDVRNRWEQYLTICEKYNILPSWSGVASVMGATEEELLHHSQNPEIARIRQLVTTSTTVGMNAKVISDASGIFRLKNESGYKDAREQLLLGEVRYASLEEIEQRYGSIEAVSVAVEQPNGKGTKRPKGRARRNLPGGK